MKYSCEMIRDLLPLYVDDVCSTKSKCAIEEHISCCDACRTVLAQMRADIGEESVASFSEDGVLQKTYWEISKRAILSAAGVTVIILYWLIFTWQEFLTEAGDYRYFSYRFHEIWDIGYWIVPLLSLLWLIVLIVRTVKHWSWRTNAAILLILGVLLVGQLSFLHVRGQTVSVTCVCNVVAVPDDYHVVIQTERGNVILETAPSITALLETGETKYMFTYRCEKGDPLEGKLSFATLIDE